MATPRKFSEKIALHTQKQAEETAAFEQIMKEVGYATRGGDQAPYQAFPQISDRKMQGYGHHTQAHTLRPPGPRYGSQSVQGNNAAFYGGSLPNVSPLEMVVSRPHEILQAHIDLQGALNTLNDMKQGRPKAEPRSRGTSLSKGSRARSSHNESRKAPTRVDCSPYASPYLSPPSPEAHWRRTNSDSALHQSSAVNGHAQGNNHGASLSPSPPALHSNSLKIPSPMHHNWAASPTTLNPINGDYHYNTTPEALESRNGWPSKTTHGCLIRKRKDRSFPPPRYNSTGCMLRHVAAALPNQNGFSDRAPLAQFKAAGPVGLVNNAKQSNTHHHLAASSSSSDMLKLCMSHIYLNKLKQQNLHDPAASNESDSDRPRSCEVPGINVTATNPCPLPEHEAQPLALGNNTGSLPDLSTLHFPSPLSVPIDHDDYPGHTTYESLRYVPRSEEPYPGSPHTQSFGGPVSTFSTYQPQQQYSTQAYCYVSNGSTSIAEHRSDGLGSSYPLLIVNSPLTASVPYSNDQPRSASFVASPTFGGLANVKGSQPSSSFSAYYLDQNNNVQSYNQGSYYKDHSAPQETTNLPLLNNSYNAVDPNAPSNNLYPSYNSSFEDGLNKDPMMGFCDVDRNQKSMYTIDSYSRSLGQAYPTLDEAFMRSKERGMKGHNLSVSPSSHLDWDRPNASLSNHSPYYSYAGPDRYSTSLNSRRYHSTTIDPYLSTKLEESQPDSLYLPHKSPLGNALSDDDQAAAFGAFPNRRSRSQENGRNLKKRPNNPFDNPKLNDCGQAPSLVLGDQQQFYNGPSQEPTSSPSSAICGTSELTCESYQQGSNSEVSSPYSVKSTQPTSPLNPLDPYNQYYHQHQQQQYRPPPGYPFKSLASSSYTNISVSAFDTLPLAELALGSGSVTDDYMTNHDPLTSALGPGSELGLLPDSECCIGDLLMDTMVIGVSDSSLSPREPRIGGAGGQNSPTTNPTITLNGGALSDECGRTQAESNDVGTLNVDEFLDIITGATYASSPSTPRDETNNQGSFWSSTPYGITAGNSDSGSPTRALPSLKSIPHIILTGADDKLMMTTNAGCNSLSEVSFCSTTLSSAPFNSIYDKRTYGASNDSPDMATTTH